MKVLLVAVTIPPVHSGCEEILFSLDSVAKDGRKSLVLILVHMEILYSKTALEDNLLRLRKLQANCKIYLKKYFNVNKGFLHSRRRNDSTDQSLHLGNILDVIYLFKELFNIFGKFAHLIFKLIPLSCLYSKSEAACWCSIKTAYGDTASLSERKNRNSYQHP